MENGDVATVEPPDAECVLEIQVAHSGALEVHAILSNRHATVDRIAVCYAPGTWRYAEREVEL